jgi:hypothetical protein
MLISGCRNPRLGIGPLIGDNSNWSDVTLSSRKRSWPDTLSGRQMTLKPRPAHFPANPASGPSGLAISGNGFGTAVWTAGSG